jgi:ABC-2 type transport system ATP-binding protein
LEIGSGEWIGLLGPNGAGKTTLMHAVAGVQRLDRGSIEIHGTENTTIGGGDGVGFVPQGVALYPLLSAEENLEAFGRLHGVPRRELRDRVNWALDWTDLTGRARDKVVCLSGGMQRRLNIACGVLHRPRLVLLDEPTVGVDPQGRQRIWEMLRTLVGQGTTLIQSTHELNEIQSICDRMLIMDHGRVIATGTVTELVAQTLDARPRVRLELERPSPSLSLEAGDGFEIDGTTLHGTLDDIADELPRVFGRLRAAGVRVRGLQVDTPGLEAVFTSLTGRDLRE